MSAFLPTANRLLLLPVALLANALFGGPLRLHQRLGLLTPLYALRLFIRKSERKLNRARRSETTRRLRGYLLVCVLLGAAGVGGLMLQRACALHPYGFVFETLALALLLPQRKISEQARFLLRRMRGDDIAISRHALSSIAQRDVEMLDNHGLGRAGIEHLAEHFCAVLVPVALGYAWLGLSGALIMRMAHLLWQMLGVQSPGAFGEGARAFCPLILLPGAALGVVILAVAATFAPGATPAGAFRSFSLTAAPGLAAFLRLLPLAAAGGALQVTLGGVRRRKHHLLAEAWVGEGTAKATPLHVTRAFWLYWIACGLHATLWLVWFSLARG